MFYFTVAASMIANVAGELRTTFRWLVLLLCACGPLAGQSADNEFFTAKEMTAGDDTVQVRWKNGAASFWQGAADKLCLQSSIAGVAYLTSVQPMRDDVSVEAEVSNLASCLGGHQFMLARQEAMGKFSLASDQEISAVVMCCIYIADGRSNPNYFFVYYRDKDGACVTYGPDGAWKKGWHNTGISWESDKSYRLSIRRGKGVITMAIRCGDKILLETKPLPAEKVNGGDEPCDFILGDAFSAYTSGMMLVRGLTVNGRQVNLRQALAALPSMKLVGDDLPYVGLFHFGANEGYIQIPSGYDPAKKTPFILFFHGRGGTAGNSNLLTPEFTDFRREAERRGYIVVCPGYGSDCWMNEKAEKIALDCVVFLKGKLNIDPQRFYVMGCSMGGAGALVFAMRHKEMPAAVCDVFGITDFVRFYKEIPSFDKSIAAAYGGTPDEVPHVYRERSAIHHVDVLKSLPLLIIHGDKDSCVPGWNSDTLYQKLKEAGARVEYLVAPGVGHDNAIIKGREGRVLDFFAANVKKE